MNDPHGIYWLDGVYHLYFQHVPDAVEWQTGISWGHATSKDLVHWRPAAPVLAPGEGDEGIWSGSAVIDDDGRPVLFYTSAGGEDVDLGRIRSARLSQAGDQWVKGPVVVEAVDTATRVFRDPTVFRDGDHWTMVVGSGRSDGTASAEVFSSSDLESWTPVGILASRSTRSQHPWTGAAWECPQVSAATVMYPTFSWCRSGTTTRRTTWQRRQGPTPTAGLSRVTGACSQPALATSPPRRSPTPRDGPA